MDIINSHYLCFDGVISDGCKPFGFSIMKNLYYGAIIFVVGLITGGYLATPSDYLFLKEANAFKYEMLMAADDYIVNSQKIFDKLEAETSFADTYGESDACDSMYRAYEVYDSLLMTQL